MARVALKGSPFGGALALEHQRLMAGSGGAIDWSRSTAHALPDRVRAPMGELWRAIMEAEHRSAGIFATFVLDLMGAGAPREVLSIASRAVLDEVRHAELCARLAELYTGAPEAPPAGIPHVPDDPALTLFEQSVRQALFLSVASETYSAVMLAETHARARDPVVRAVLSVILADEVHHARLGWSYLAYLLRSPEAERVRALVAAHLLPVLDDLARALFGADPGAALPPPSFRGRDAALAAAHGYLPMRAQYALFVQTVREVWAPTFAGLGFDATALAARYPAIRA